ncbi:axial regulator YABBY 4 [Prosopis cineraria]|uniref:axial regulator YABBY 4 n=1 Tax=Prosopis cineraria TaxID=364024 RepID=UPI0024102820|nr:axial regulator YABBY 4 [Prosopis cineraria]XP_054808832.1 axial regulator YABBY 4 [Prosopis cineraria]
MSTLNDLHLQEHICYVKCGFCTTILLVSVPCSSLSMEVTVRCGNCTTLLSVSMMKASFVPFQLFPSLTCLDQPKEGRPEENIADKSTCSDSGEDDAIPMSYYAINERPGKRQKTPSAYNRFIREEIRRLKIENPDMVHKEAFRTAAKNWANFPQAQSEGDEGSSQSGQVENTDSTCGPT